MAIPTGTARRTGLRRRHVSRLTAAIAAAGTTALTLGAAVAMPPAAMAAGPTRTVFPPTPHPTTVYDLCSFPVVINAVQAYTLLDFTDASGAGKQIYHVNETDTFTGPTGKTLRSTTYTFDLHVTWDAQGNATQLVGTGGAMFVPLPGGSSFFSAGRTDFLQHPDEDFVAVPDAGTARNLPQFCAALA